MVTVTALARKKITDLLNEHQENPETALRLAFSETHPNMLELLLDTAAEDDSAIRDDSGKTLLVIDPQADAATEGMVIDYRETRAGGRFTLENVQ